MNKDDYNLNLIEDLVTTQYGDYGGYIQIDGRGISDLSKLCEDHGIDLDKFFLIGFTCGEHTVNGIGKRDEVSCTALVLEKEKYGHGFDDIKENLASQSRIANAKQFSFKVKTSDFGKYIKRFQFAVTTKLSKHISKLEIEDI